MNVDASEVSARYRTVATAYLERIDALDEDAWVRPTPCEEWTVRDLVAHSIAVHRRTMAKLDETEPPGIEPEPPRPGENLPAELRALVAAVQDAVDDPDRAARLVEHPAGPQPFAEFVGSLVCADTLVHTWDLARATGQDERLDRGAVDVTLAGMLPMDEFIRGPGRFGARLDPEPDADAQTQLLLFCGRNV